MDEDFPAGAVVSATRRDIEKLGPEAVETGLAATALALAAELDASNSATSKSMVATSLIKVMQELRASAPPKIQEDRVDEIAQRRARRVGGSASA